MKCRKMPTRQTIDSQVALRKLNGWAKAFCRDADRQEEVMASMPDSGRHAGLSEPMLMGAFDKRLRMN